MTFSEEIGLSGLAAIGTIGSVCAILLKSTHQNLKTLDTMRREASAAAENLRQELRDHDDTIFKLQGLCADYRCTIAKLEADLLRRASMGQGSSTKSTFESPDQSPPATEGSPFGTRLEDRQPPSPATENHKPKTKPEDVL